MTFLRQMRGIHLLLVFVPISITAALVHAPALFVFVLAAISIIPLSGIMGHATEDLARRLGPQWGGLLNATFGNATELIIGILALRSGLIQLTRASIVGSILGNILLVLGGAALAAGIKYKQVKFNADLAQTNSITLLLAVVALSVPAIFLHTYPNDPTPFGPIEKLSIAVAGLLLVFYVALLFFSLKTHEYLFNTRGNEGDTLEDEPCMTQASALWSLAIASVVVAFESDLLVGSVKGATAAAHINEVFVGIIIVPIIGNAAEHASAVTMALKNKMDIAISISLGSSIQVAMFVAPFLVLTSLFFPHHLSMVFPGPETLSVTLAAAIAAFIANDGKMYWLEGAQLLAAYAIIALAFFFLPA